jgi:hypothetical protein
MLIPETSMCGGTKPLFPNSSQPDAPARELLPFHPSTREDTLWEMGNPLAGASGWYTTLGNGKTPRWRVGLVCNGGKWKDPSLARRVGMLRWTAAGPS